MIVLLATLWGPGEGNPWTEEPGGLQSVGSQRVGYDLVSRPPPPHFGVVLKCFIIKIFVKDLKKPEAPGKSVWLLYL